MAVVATAVVVVATAVVVVAASGDISRGSELVMVAVVSSGDSSGSIITGSSNAGRSSRTSSLAVV